MLLCLDQLKRFSNESGFTFVLKIGLGCAFGIWLQVFGVKKLVFCALCCDSLPREIVVNCGYDFCRFNELVTVNFGPEFVH